jgi:hypothetical protein
MDNSLSRRSFEYLSDARNIARWGAVLLSLVSIVFAALSYFGFFNYVRGDDLLDALASRLDTSYATDVSRQVRPPDPEWHPLMRVIRSYSPARATIPRDREPVVFARMAAVASAKSEAGEWTAPTTPIVLLYRELSPGTSLLPGQDGWTIGTLGDFHEWIRRDEADFDFFWRTLIFGALSACVGVFLALPERQRRTNEGGMPAGREDEEFMRLGVQYYIAARSSAWAGLMPVCGNLYHHTLEMFLKAGLSRKHSSPALKKIFGHRLIDIWNTFKTDFPSTTLMQFDSTIVDIEEFENVRYPDNVLKHGARMVIDYRGSAPAQISQPSVPPEPSYKLYFDDIDRLIGEIFRVSSRNPLFFTSGLKPEVQEMLGRDNPVAAQILPQKSP